MTIMLILESAEVDIAYNVHGPLSTADGRPPLFMIGQPMTAGGFGTLASHFPDRTVVTSPRVGRLPETFGSPGPLARLGKLEESPSTSTATWNAVSESALSRPLQTAQA